MTEPVYVLTCDCCRRKVDQLRWMANFDESWCAECGMFGSVYDVYPELRSSSGKDTVTDVTDVTDVTESDDASHPSRVFALDTSAPWTQPGWVPAAEDFRGDPWLPEGLRGDDAYLEELAERARKILSSREGHE